MGKKVKRIWAFIFVFISFLGLVLLTIGNVMQRDSLTGLNLTALERLDYLRNGYNYYIIGVVLNGISGLGLFSLITFQIISNKH